FFDVLSRDFFGIFQYIFQSITSGNSSSKWDRTIRTFIVTTVLNFQKGSGSVSDRVAANIEVSFSNFTRMYFSKIIFRKIVEVVCDFEFFGSSRSEERRVGKECR